MRIMTNWRENKLSEFLALNLKRNSNNLLNLLLNSASFKINSRKIAEKSVNLKINSRILAEFLGNFGKNSNFVILSETKNLKIPLVILSKATQQVSRLSRSKNISKPLSYLSEEV
ncbi:hypothetical protein DMC01_04425 [Campylobacter troglodytis]|nr:hypothetical protein DMC01_04425 [Campylobacter troglodytis]